jgi:hypothetical protein
MEADSNLFERARVPKPSGIYKVVQEGGYSLLQVNSSGECHADECRFSALSKIPEDLIYTRN